VDITEFWQRRRGIVVTDAGGVVRATHIGPATTTDLWATLADIRESRPE